MPYGFYQCYSSLTDSIVLSHFAQTKIAAQIPTVATILVVLLKGADRLSAYPLFYYHSMSLLHRQSICKFSKHMIRPSLDTTQPFLYAISRGAAYTKRQAVIMPRKRGDAYGFYQYYSSLTDSIVLSHFA